MSAASTSKRFGSVQAKQAEASSGDFVPGGIKPANRIGASRSFSTDEQLMAALFGKGAGTGSGDAMGLALDKMMGPHEDGGMVSRNFRHLIALSSDSPVLQSAAQAIMYGATPEQVVASMAQSEKSTGNDWHSDCPSIKDLKRMQELMQQYGIKADPGHGYPIESPFNPLNPNGFAQMNLPQFARPDALSKWNPQGATDANGKSLYDEQHPFTGSIWKDGRDKRV